MQRGLAIDPQAPERKSAGSASVTGSIRLLGLSRLGSRSSGVLQPTDVHRRAERFHLQQLCQHATRQARSVRIRARDADFYWWQYKSVRCDPDADKQN